MVIKCLLALASFLLITCTSPDIRQELIKNLYVDDFHSDDVMNCKTSDVGLSHIQAKSFFQRAKEVDYKTLHDHYEIAPCYIEGPLTYKGEPCSWKIRAGSTGSIRCKDKEWYFVCDDCDDLFNHK